MTDVYVEMGADPNAKNGWCGRLFCCSRCVSAGRTPLIGGCRAVRSNLKMGTVDAILSFGS